MLSTSYFINWKRNALGLFISCACLGFIVWHIDLDELVGSISGFQWGWLLFGLLSLSFGYLMRIVRWSCLLRAAGANITISKCAAPFLGSIALNNIFPMRLGDVVRALVFPSAIGIGRITATGSLIMERLVDLMTLLTCLAIGLALTTKAHLPDLMVGTVVFLAISGTAILMLFFVFSGRLSRRFGYWADKVEYFKHKQRLNVLKDMLQGFNAMSRLRVLIMLFVLSMLVWAGEAGLYWAILWGFGLDVGAGGALVVMAIATLATLAPSSPGYVGPFHLAAFSAVIMLGGGADQAASFAVLAHLGVWLPTTIAGSLAILLHPQLFGRTHVTSREDASEARN